MYRNTRRVTLPLALALCAAIGAVPVALGAPSITRGHFEFEARVDACGIGTIQMTVDALSVVNQTDNHVSFNILGTGTAVDTVTGTRYRLVDHTTQVVVGTHGAVDVQVAERTFVLAGRGGGLVSRGLVRFAIRPDGSISDFELQFVECHPA